MTEKNLIIGIDAGVNTGVAIWNRQERSFLLIKTVSILEAFRIVKSHKESVAHVFVEDARQVKYRVNAAKSQGAGSVKRDCQIWEDFLIMYGISSTFVRPNKSITKMDSSLFSRTTGYTGRTSSHGRDAAMLVFKR